MNIKLNQEQIKQARDEYLIINSEELELTESSSEMDDNGKYITHVFHRKSDDKYFEVNLCFARYGYEDYGFELDEQDYIAYEVKKKEVTKYEWAYVE
jgi:hypothetical protein